MAGNYTNGTNKEINSLLTRMGWLLEAGDFRQADECCNYILHLLPGYGIAYLGKLLAEFHLKQPEDLLYTDLPFSRSQNYNFAISYSDEETRRFLIAAPYENYYLRAKKQMAESEPGPGLLTAAEMFDQIADYRDSRDLAKQCRDAMQSGEVEEQYQKAIRMMDQASDVESLQAAADALSCLNGYRDSAEKRKACLRWADSLRKDNIYASAVDPTKCNDLKQLRDSLEKYESIRGWKDSVEKASLCRNRIMDLEKASRSRKKRGIVIGIIALIIAGIAAVMLFVIVPMANYNRANAMLQNGSYEEAAAAFHALHGFMDSEEKARESEQAISEIHYQDALTLLEAGDFEQAQAAFEALGDYRDSAAKAAEAAEGISEILYQTAAGYVDSGSYMEAINILTTLNGYSDSATLLNRAYDGEASSLTQMETDAAVRELQTLSPEVSGQIISRLDPETDSDILVYFAEAGDVLYLGQFEQNDDPAGGLEPIQWVVLDRQEDVLTLISRQTLDVRPFNSNPEPAAWTDCSLREWLNGDFYYDAFAPGERRMIRQVTNRTQNAAGETLESQDFVYLLSADEASAYFAEDQDRIAEATAFVLSQGANAENGNTTWWLRSSGYDEHNAAYVYTDGSIHRNGIYIFSTTDAVRPVIQIRP